MHPLIARAKQRTKARITNKWSKTSKSQAKRDTLVLMGVGVTEEEKSETTG